MLKPHNQTSQLIKAAGRKSIQERYSGLITWELYNWQYYARKGQPLWILHDGPPFASGKAHLGHLYNKTLKDIINRYKLLNGYRVHFIPGFDCYGTSVEDMAMANASQGHSEFAKEAKLSLSKKVKDDNEQLPLADREALKRRKTIREYVKNSALTQM